MKSLIRKWGFFMTDEAQEISISVFLPLSAAS